MNKYYNILYKKNLLLYDLDLFFGRVLTVDVCTNEEW